MPRIVCISDTHNFHDEINIPDGDVLIHSGDATMHGTIEEIVLFNKWFKKFPHRHKIFVAGNHDWLFETNNKLARTLLDTSIKYLQDDLIKIENLKFFGSPWQPRFFNWAFNLTRGAEMAEKWRLIPEDTEILITHGPPFGVLDEVSHQDSIENTGCEELIERVKIVQPRLHVFGHIHCGYGTIEKFGIKFINAAVCDESYEAVNLPIVFDL